RRFQAEQVTGYIDWQAGLVREYSRPEQFVTTCLALDRPATDEAKLTRGLDVAATNPYYAMQDYLDRGFDLPRPEPWIRSGITGLLELADRSYAAKQGRFLVTETNAQAIGFSGLNLPPYPGQLQQAGLALVARGAAMIEYWHWHTNHFGAETYWMGVLPHSQEPGRVYRELAELGRILAHFQDRLDGYVPDADVAIMFSTDSKYALEFQPPFADGAHRTGTYTASDPTAYHDIVEAFASGAREAGAQVRYVHADQFSEVPAAELAAAYPVIVAAGFYTATTAQLAVLRDYAAAGGHLILGIRTGYGDDEARARCAVAPDVVGQAAGVRYDEFTTLREPLALVGDIAEGARATRWADLLVADAQTTILASYDHPEFGRYPALTTREHGSGRVTYVGTVPNRQLAADVIGRAVTAPRAGQWSAEPTVTVMSGTTPSAGYYFVHNWSAHAATVTPPVSATELTRGVEAVAGVPLEIPARSSLVFAHTSTPSKEKK
ncbi:MAG: beta-galactosidase, partial [Arachnia sp.]